MPDDPTPAHVTLETFPLGDWDTNCYLLYTTPTATPTDTPASTPPDAWIIDAGFDPDPLLDRLDELALTPSGLILTHAHLDHIGGLHDIRSRFPDLPILIHEAEREFLTDTTLNLSAFAGRPVVAPDATGTLAHGDTLTLGGHAFHILHTPGHSPGGITLHAPSLGLALVGDTLFSHSIGRSDFPTSDAATLLHSIRTHLLTLPDPTHILPGHGPETTVHRERTGNPFL